MLRIRLLFGLLTLVILLWAVGATGIFILGDAGRKFQTRLKEDYQAIDAASTFRIGSSVMNSHYATTLVVPPAEEPLDPQLYEETIQDFDDALAQLRVISNGNRRWTTNIDKLKVAINLYQQDYAQILSGRVTTEEARSQLLKSIGSHTQRITDLSGNLASFAEERLFASSEILLDESHKNALFIGSFLMLGTGIAILIYFQLLRHLVDPIVGLRSSMEEVSMGNFELTMPTPSKGSELSSLVTSFNSMAAELRVRRRETDDRLLRKNLVNRALLSAIPSPVYVLDPDGRIVQLNPAAEHLSEALGLPSHLPKKVQRLFERCRKEGSDLLPEDAREALLFRIAETEHFYLPRIFHFSDESHEYLGWAVFLQDVTRIRWLDDMKTNMLATISHEIKTPLTGIRMVLYLLLEERSGELSGMQKEMLTSATGDCERLLNTLNTLLDLARAESGATQLERKPTDLGKIAEECAALFQPKAASAGSKIQMTIPEDLPRVSVDRVRISEVVNNLISNAIKHSPPRGSIEITLNKLDSEFVRLSVLDEGPGVPDDFQVRIFERFFRAPGQKSEGAGLGLFISREIIRAHDGRIGIGDANGDQKRTEFFFDVPVV